MWLRLIPIRPSAFAWSQASRRRSPTLAAQAATVERLEVRTLLSSISGTVFEDLDADGLLDSGESGLANVTVYLDDNQNGLLDGGETSVLSDSNGDYLIGGLGAGDYTLRQLVGATFLETTPAAGLYPVSLDGVADATNLHFGNWSTLARITGIDINDSGNRSGLGSLSLTFDRLVNVASVTSLNLFNHTTATAIDASTAAVSGNGTMTLRWDFSGLSLPDGRYTAELPADQVSTTVGGQLATTHTIAFHVLGGDVSGDGRVNASDFVDVDVNFDPILGTPYRPGDASGDGRVNASDFVEVDNHFNPLLLAPLEFDFGDAPGTGTSFPTTLAVDGARHVLTGNTLFLGVDRDSEADGQPSATADGDGSDEDGITFGDLIVGGNAAVTVTSSGAGLVSGWVDFNQDGDWDDPGEQVFADAPVVGGANNLQIAIPAGATLGNTFARFRLTETAGYSYHGLAPSGEVEDYHVSITNPAAPRIVLGPSDNIALDQPRATVLLTEDLDGNQQVGPFLFNEFLLDTGSNSILAFATAVSEMVDGTYSYQTEGIYSEFGVGGASLFDIGAPYYFYFAVNGNGYVPPPPLPETRILSNATSDLSILGPWGIAGMPLMDGRVVSLDFSGWSGGLLPDLSNIYMVTTFSDTLPAGQNRYTVPIDNRISFEAEAGLIDPNDDPPIWSDIPFLTAILSNQGADRSGNFLLDTGGQLSILSTHAAFDLNLDSNGDGLFDANDANYVDSFEIGGVGGSVIAPMFFIEELRLPTEEGDELVWTDLGWLILDIDTGEGQPPLDGVFGMDNLTGGWINTIFEQGPDGYFQQVHFDFRNWSSGSGHIYFDLTTPPSPSASAASAVTSGPAVSPFLASALSSPHTFRLADQLNDVSATETVTGENRIITDPLLLLEAPFVTHQSVLSTISEIFPSRPLKTLSLMQLRESLRLSLITTRTEAVVTMLSPHDPADEWTIQPELTPKDHYGSTPASVRTTSDNPTNQV